MSSASIEFAAVAYKNVLRDFSLAVEAGETLVLLGGSGAGKSTALRLVNALLVADAGLVLIEGKSTRAWNPIELRRRIGYVAQDGGLFPHLTVAENIALGPKLNGWTAAKTETRVAEMLERVALSGLGARFPEQLSGGQRQRVSVARALAADPTVLLLDEPFSALDPLTRLALQKAFREIAESLRTTAIFVTHDLREAMRVGTRIALLSEGRIVALHTPEALLQSQEPLVRAYLETLA